MSRCQQFEMYAAEDRAIRGRDFETLDEIQRWMDDLRDTPWWAIRHGAVRSVEIGDAPRRGLVGPGLVAPGMVYMELRPDQMYERIVLHELAHALCQVKYGESCAHGPRFARMYLELVSLIMGADAYVSLRDEFDKDGIEYDPGIDERLGVRYAGPATTEEGS